jgi:hypothetical protein
MPGCGDDEGTGDGGDDGGNEGCSRDEDCPGTEICDDIGGDNDTVCDEGETCECGPPGGGGTGGQGGSGGATIGGSGGSATGGTGGVAPTTTIGEPCSSDEDCDGLTCLVPNGLPSGDGPPNGMCTVLCDSDDQCLELADVAYCVGFEEDENMEVVSYCILGCEGSSRGAPKCRTRDDFACGILDTTPTTEQCESTLDCDVDQVCFSDVEGGQAVCQNMLTACRPTCRADSDCEAEQFCDFTSGFCTATEPTGLPIGSLCDPNLPAAQDECNGFCLATDDTNTEGTCAAFCSAGVNGYGCGWVGDGAPDAACLFATIISRDEAGGITLAESDLMLCGGLCDCNDDCPSESEVCIDENAGDAQFSIMALFGRPGYCRALADGETEADSIACEQAQQ